MLALLMGLNSPAQVIFKSAAVHPVRGVNRHLHAGVGFLLGEVAGQAEVGDTNVAVFIQQDISWLMGREGDTEGDTDDGEHHR